jgi:hypothetical protein
MIVRNIVDPRVVTPDEGVVTCEFLSGVRGDVGSSEPTPSPTMKMCRLFVS